MEQELAAYVSWTQLAAHNFLFTHGGKLATLWFDEIVLQVPKRDMIAEVLSSINMSAPARKELAKLWIPVQEHLPEYHFLSEPWKSDYARMVEVASRITIEETEKQDPGGSMNHPGFRREVAWAGAGLVESVNVWLALNAKRPCSILPDTSEQRTIQELFGAGKARSKVTVFTEVMTATVPDLSDAPWERIVDLRHHEFFGAFRAKLVELYEQLALGEIRSAKEIVDEVARRDMEEMVQLLRPSVGKHLLQAVAGNIPLPIPNPIGVISTIGQIAAEIELSKKYGWLYFLLDLQFES